MGNQPDQVRRNKYSVANRTLVSGVGINDADYQTHPKINGVTIECPFYKTWAKMLDRCYSERLHKSRPTYKGCLAIKEWHLFSNFKHWMENQDWQGKQLDKDIITPKNKIYSPGTCVFVDGKINTLLIKCRPSKRGLPLGVTFHRKNKKYMAQCSLDGKNKNLGGFDTPDDASAAYIKYKINLIFEVSERQSDIRVKNGLIQHAKLLLLGE